MNILIVTPIFPPVVGGPATYSKEIALRLGERGHNIRIVTLDEGNAEKLEGTPISTVSVDLSFVSRQMALLRTVLREAKHSDVIYAQDPLVCGPVCRLASLFSGKPYICKFVGDVVWETLFQQGYQKDLEEFLKGDRGFKAGLKFALEKSTLGNAAKVITPSRYLRRLLVQYYGLPDSRVSVIPNAVEVQARSKRNPFEILVIGRVVKTKRIDTIIKAVEMLRPDYPQLILKIVGTGPEIESLSSLAVMLGLEKNVVFTGQVGNDVVVEMMKEAGMLALNSNYEGMSHTILQAMACRLPVIASNIEPNAAIVADRHNGLLVENTPESIAKSISWILDNPQEVLNLVENASNVIAAEYTWNHVIEKIENALRLGNA